MPVDTALLVCDPKSREQATDVHKQNRRYGSQHFLKPALNSLNYPVTPWMSRILLSVIICISIALPLMGRTPGIRFIDEMFFVNGAWLLAENGSFSMSAADVMDEGRAGQFYVPGLNGRLYSQNPVGFSLLLAVIYIAGGWKAMFNTNLMLLPVVVVLAYLLLRKWFDRSISLASVLLFSTSPVFALFSTQVMTHSLSLIIQLSGLLMIINPDRLPSKLRYILGGLILGLGLLVRLDSVLMLIPLVLITLLPASTPLKSIFTMKKQRLIALILVLTGFAVGVLPHLIYQISVSGNAVKSGYSEHLKTIRVLEISRIPDALPRALKRIQHTGLPITATIGFIGCLFLLAKKTLPAIHLGSWGISFFIFYLMFFAGTKHDFNLRYFLPAFIPLCASATWSIFSLFRNRLRFVIIPLFLITATVFNLQGSFRAISSRNRAIRTQARLIETVNQVVQEKSTVFLPPQEALMMEVMGTDFDIRNTDYLLADKPVGATAPIPGNQSGKPSNPHLVIRMKKGNLNRSIPELLPRLLHKGHRIFVVCSEKHARRLSEVYGVSVTRIASLDDPAPGNIDGIFRVTRFDT